MIYGQSFKKNMICPTLLRMICIPSTSGIDELSSTSPLCFKTQGNAKVSGDDHCNVEGDPIIDYPSSLSHCNA
jgi:hypothetical protein